MPANVPRRTRQSLALYAAMACAAIYSLFPIYWMVISSLRDPAVLYNSVSLLPGPFSLESYTKLLAATDFTVWFTNSVIVAVCSGAITVVLSVIIAYAVTRLPVPGKTAIVGTMLMAYMFPPLLLAIPLYAIFVKLGLDDTHLGLILAHTTITLPLGVWLLWGFFKQMPFDIEEAAMVDGCSRLGAFFHVVLPLALPGIVTVVIFAFLLSWSDYIFALVMVNSDLKKTLPAGIETMVGQYELRDGELMAGSVLMALPLFLAFMFLNRYFIQGLSAGALKQ
jgi:ABC-type glycerol-3-phosphate transport system permease component